MTGSSMAGARRVSAAVVAMLGASALSGCITLEAPQDTIVIELNINITQEVIYRLAEDAGNTIEENASIF
ncbi:YnbE family lipoprotein [Aurantiacibacter poecillastricola]|uniref:YnbE family lipoprotein n=1 Tax=Aurantiacibacter poecillastricola TaxID=3064385 RepID=UPI00273D895C|nr:YnbE family lipoprotein [Aurantiacibacter sp. 219JJ12-13]MDP5261745.1 YnbE family lipoprotein [Aurantiacibacter sp. 219JJ12-13]